MRGEFGVFVLCPEDNLVPFQRRRHRIDRESPVQLPLGVVTMLDWGCHRFIDNDGLAGFRLSRNKQLFLRQPIFRLVMSYKFAAFTLNLRLVLDFCQQVTVFAHHRIDKIEDTVTWENKLSTSRQFLFQVINHGRNDLTNVRIELFLERPAMIVLNTWAIVQCGINGDLDAVRAADDVDIKNSVVILSFPRGECHLELKGDGIVGATNMSVKAGTG